jgi:hypothetical protein
MRACGPGRPAAFDLELVRKTGVGAAFCGRWAHGVLRNTVTTRYPSSACQTRKGSRGSSRSKAARRRPLRPLSVAQAGERCAISRRGLGFATLDTHRALRRGFPETVYGPGKSIEQIVAIVSKLHAAGQTALVTRVGPEVHAAVAVTHPKAEYHAAARALVLRSGPKPRGRAGVVVLTAGTTDIGVAEEAALTAELMGSGSAGSTTSASQGSIGLLSHHETLTKANVIVAVAGMEGALPSVVAASSTAPWSPCRRASIRRGAAGVRGSIRDLELPAHRRSRGQHRHGHGAGCLASLINRRCRLPKTLRESESGRTSPQAWGLVIGVRRPNTRRPRGLTATGATARVAVLRRPESGAEETR